MIRKVVFALALLCAATTAHAADAVVPMPLSTFAPSPNAQAPAAPFRGRLQFKGHVATGFKVLRDDFGYEKEANQVEKSLPDFDFELVTVGGALVPVTRGRVVSNHPAFQYVLEPGRVWNEPGDNGITRAALPFALQERNANCLHNGVMTFLFKPDGSLSKLAYQISSETCLYYKFDMWGQTQASYTPGAVAGEAAIAAAYNDEVASRLPVKPISALASDHPGANPGYFGIASEVAPEHMTAFGFVIDGVHYTSACDTRAGPYPYCDVLDLPSYSIAKSIFAGFALMRLERLYPGAKSKTIGELVPECAGANWNDVTLANALDMATGNYASSKAEADEDSETTWKFLSTETLADKLRLGCAAFPRNATPGTTWAYHTIDTFLLGVAMQNFWRQKNGPKADIYNDLIVRDLWTPLKLSLTARVTQRTLDAAAQPFAGWGLTLHRDDVAKIAMFLNSDRARELLAPVELDAALQRDPSNSGLKAGGADYRYKNGFWAWNAAKMFGCRKPAWIPFMSGYGGNSVALMPNGTVYYYFSDNNQFAWGNAAAESNRIRPFCKGSPQ